MFAIAFDMSIARLKEHYGQPYNNAYYEIGEILEEYQFYNTQGSVYLTQNSDMANLFEAIDALSSVSWFQDSVRDIRAFRVEDWSDFTNYVKRKGKLQKGKKRNQRNNEAGN
jgi:virulence-associated protein VapD